MTKLNALLAGCLLIVACASQGDSQTAEDSEPKIYQNSTVEHKKKGFFDFLAMRFFGEHEWADHAAQAEQVPTQDLSQNQLQSEASSMQVVWLGHSTFLIQYRGLNILTDPVFSQRASPLSFAGPKRYTQPAMEIDELPPIDLVVISHNHYDHLDIDSVLALPESTQFYLPDGLSQWFIDLGVDRSRVADFTWWQQRAFSAELTVTATPAQHWSARSLFDKNQTHWASWHLQIGDKSVWFAGDTGYNQVDFKQIGQRFELVDVALIPIGAYAPRDFMHLYHVNVEEAVQIHKDVNSQFSIGMHWGAFPLTAEPVMEPPQKLEQLTQAGELTSGEFVTLAIGEVYRL